MLLLLSYVFRADAAPLMQPTVQLLEAEAYRFILTESSGSSPTATEGDWLILVRYKLPFSEWSNSTYVDDTACADASDFVDPCYTSVKEGIVLQTFYNGARAGTGITLAAVRTLPRIGVGLSAVHIRAGHGLTWNSSAYEVCIEGSASISPAVTPACLTLVWNSGTSISGTRSVLTTDIVQMMINLEVAANARKSRFVRSDLITETGSTFPTEAFTAFPTIAPAAFYAGVTSIATPFGPTPISSKPLVSAAESAAQSSQFYTDLNRVSQEVGGVSVRTVGSILILLMAAGAILVTMLITNEPALAILIGAVFVGEGYFLGLVPPVAVFTTLAVVFMIGVIWIVRRIPT